MPELWQASPSRRTRADYQASSPSSRRPPEPEPAGRGGGARVPARPQGDGPGFRARPVASRPSDPELAYDVLVAAWRDVGSREYLGKGTHGATFEAPGSDELVVRTEAIPSLGGRRAPRSRIQSWRESGRGVVRDYRALTSMCHTVMSKRAVARPLVVEWRVATQAVQLLEHRGHRDREAQVHERLAILPPRTRKGASITPSRGLTMLR